MEKDDFNELYQAMFYKDNVKANGNGISREEFKLGYFFVIFNISDSLGKDYTCNQRKGLVNLSLRFAKALEQATTAVCYARLNSKFTIDQARNVTFE